MKTKLLALALLAAGSTFAETRFNIGIGVGSGYPAPVAAYRAARPGPDYVWVDGYWTRTGWRRHWTPGYWMRRPYQGSYVAPRFGQPRYDNRSDNRYDGNGYRNR